MFIILYITDTTIKKEGKNNGKSRKIKVKVLDLNLSSQQA